MARAPQPHRRGMPDPRSVIEVTTLQPTRPSIPGALAPAIGATYQILRTNEFDPKDKIRQVSPLGLAPLHIGDNFAGTARKAAKLSISDAAAEVFDDVSNLIPTLPAKNSMKGHQPPITVEPSSGRVAEEDRNVQLRAFLYAASRETDNDFHLMIGRDPAAGGEAVYMTAEVSGLPTADSTSFAQLEAARDAFKSFFGAKLPGPSYDFYDPPIPIEISGSLFFDMSHASGQGPGPETLRQHIPTIWEIHPISSIIFEP
ncbi:hypothetical protein C1D09_003350 [Mesorhizobium intechi]|uniref:Uncharacterized protein n=1 Tax=Mesorhizobium intechi TaxID=537601 RepID=A0A8T9AWR1_9HYPH|nr:hypothetical protein [Mesorhizobium intechi]TSE13524.1 hypothetical protein C1D09_003350 [Mesorhizobium intechi]